MNTDRRSFLKGRSLLFIVIAGYIDALKDNTNTASNN